MPDSNFDSVVVGNGIRGGRQNVTSTSIPFSPTGIGVICSTNGLFFGQGAASVVATAAAVTYTPDQLKSGLILRNTAGAGRADLVPTAAALVAAMPGVVNNTQMLFTIRNTAGAAETITVTTNTGATLSGTMTIAQNNMRQFRLIITNVAAGSEAYTLYSELGGTF